MDVYEKALQLHYDLAGKIEVISRAELRTAEDLALAYTPGVAEPCRVIAKNEAEAYDLCSYFRTWLKKFKLSIS